jgi:hypothetical protein
MAVPPELLGEAAEPAVLSEREGEAEAGDLVIDVVDDLSRHGIGHDTTRATTAAL